jgi:hypothetical protein
MLYPVAASHAVTSSSSSAQGIQGWVVVLFVSVWAPFYGVA